VKYVWAIIGGLLVAAGVLVVMVQRSSFADLRVAYQPSPGQYANRRAFYFALLGVLCFYGATIGFFVLLLRMRGYASWDSTGEYERRRLCRSHPKPAMPPRAATARSCCAVPLPSFAS